MGKHNHSYNGCNHILQHCTHCDVVYCTKCSREWTAGGNYIWDKLKEYDRNWKTTPYYVGDDLRKYTVTSGAIALNAGGHAHD